MESSELNIRISVYKDGRIQTKTLQDFLNRRVLFCSVTRPSEVLTIKYLEYIRELRDKLSKHNVDLVLMISTGGLFSIARINVKFVDIPTLFDNDGGFVKMLSQRLNKTQSIDILSKFWSYQVLFNGTEIEQFYEQPTEDHIRNLLKSAKGDSEKLSMLKFHWKDVDENQVFQRVMLKREEGRPEYGSSIFYYNLWPNVQLEQYLVDNTVVK